MNTLKKTVAVVLAVAMVLTMGIATSFAAFTDVQSTAGYAEAVNILANLGILNGYTDGSFKPNNTITRAEVAVIMCRVLNADPNPGTTPFTDVPANHWAAGEINTAYSLGVINGYPDGTFRPEGNVLYEQVVKMIVCALQYEPKVQGNYPTGYLAVASEKDISKGANGTVGQPATRATVAKLVYNSLEVDKLAPVEYGYAGSKWAEKEGETLLKGLGIEKLEVVVTETYYTRAADNDYDPDDKTVVLASNKKNQTYKDEEFEKATKDTNADTIECQEGGTAAGSMLGYACVAYVGEDEETGDDVIYAITAKSSKNSVTTVTSDRFVEEEDLTSAESNKNNEGTVYYWGNSTKTPSRIAPDSDGILVYVNYADNTTEFDEAAGTAYYDLLNKDGGVVEFIDNDGDGDYNVAVVSQYTNELVIGSVRVLDGIYTFRRMEGSPGSNIDQYDPEDEEQLKLFVKGENYIDPSEIAEGDTITVVGDEQNDHIIIYLVSSDKVDGRSTSYDSEAETLSIAGKAYSKSPSYNADLSEFRNFSGTFYFNADGLLAFADGSSTASGNYGYVVGTLLDQDWKNAYEMRLVDANGQVQTYKLRADGVFVTDGTNNGKSHKVDVEDIHDKFDIKGAGETLNPVDRIVMYTLSNGEIRNLTYVSDYDDIEKSARELDEDIAEKYDIDDHSFGGESLNENTVVFTVDKEDDQPMIADEDYITVTKGYGKFVDGDEYPIVTFTDDNVVTAAVQITTANKVDNEQHVFVVTNISTDVNADDENIVKFTGIQDGTTTSFELYDDDKDYANSIGNDDYPLGKGSVLLVGPEVGGYVDTIQILVEVLRDGSRLGSITGAGYETGNVKSRDIDYISGLTTVEQVEDDDEMVYVTSNGYVQLSSYTDPSEKGYKPSSSTDVTFVDFTTGRNFSAATIRGNRGDLSDLEVNDVDSCAFALFFRAYDVKDASENFDIQNERSRVLDVVVYKVSDASDINVDGALADVGGNSWDDDDDYEDVETVVDTADDDVIDVTGDDSDSTIVWE